MCISAFQCKIGWPNKRRMTDIVNPWRILALSPIMVLFPNLVPLAESRGRDVRQPSLWLVTCPLEIYGSSFHKYRSSWTRQYTMKEVQIFVFFLLNIMLLFGMNHLFLPSTFQRKMNRKTCTNNVFHCVHCHSLIYFLCSCLQLLKIISLECKWDMILHAFMWGSYSSNSSYPLSFAIQFMAFLPVLSF